MVLIYNTLCNVLTSNKNVLHSTALFVINITGFENYKVPHKFYVSASEYFFFVLRHERTLQDRSFN